MQKHTKMTLTVVLAFAIIMSMATGVLATEQEHTHDWQVAWSSDSFHCMVCSGCGEEKTTTHTKDSEGVCTVCGHTPHEHIWQYTPGENYDSNHGMHCTKCAATSTENHIYGNDGKCTVCGNTPPHVHQWEWDGNESNNLHYHITVCSCGATTSEDHRLTWNGKIGDDRGHRMICSVCGFGSFVFDHTYNSAYFNGERCSVCSYSTQSATEPETKPNETIPKETKPAETTPVETMPIETMPIETTPVETESAENEPTDVKPTPTETMPQNTAKDDSQHSGSVWVWVAASLVVAGGLGAVVFLSKKKSS